MTSRRPRYGNRRPLRPLAKLAVFVVLPILAVAAMVAAVTDGSPVVHARTESGSELPDFTAPGSETQTPDTGTTEPADAVTTEPEATPSPSEDEQSDEPSGESTGSGDDGSGDGGSDADDDGTALTVPPSEPDTPQPSSSPEPTEEPSPTPSSEPTDEPTEEPSEPTDTPSPTPTGPDLPFIELSDAEDELVEYSDGARTEAGCPALRVDPRLTAAAREHSDDMRDRLFYSHTNPDGETPADRAADEGYDAPVGENIAYGLRNPKQVVRSWDEGEDGQRLLDCEFTSVGAGVEYGLLGSWWTLLLGRD